LSSERAAKRILTSREDFAPFQDRLFGLISVVGLPFPPNRLAPVARDSEGGDDAILVPTSRRRMCISFIEGRALICSVSHRGGTSDAAFAELS
jgi:hypothetical protein